MTRWTEVADLELDTEHDELDPMAAPLDSIGAEDQEIDDLEQQGPWTAASGFSDPHGAVRVWVDDDVIISKVRMAPSWRERVGSGGLEAAFGLAFLQINNYFRDDTPEESLSGDDREARQPLGWHAMYELTLRNRRIREQIASLGPEASGRWVGESVTGVSHDKLVGITLDLHGKLERIEFSKSALDGARIKQISDAVVKAHREARARFVPPHYEEGLRDELLKEVADNRNELLAMMRRGFK